MLVGRYGGHTAGQRGLAANRQVFGPKGSCKAALTACKRTRGASVCVRAEVGPYKPQEFGLAPAKPQTAYGEMLQYYLAMEPQLFKAAVEDQLQKLKAERDAKTAHEQKLLGQTSTEISLYRRMEEVRASEVRATLEDLMYVSILEKFLLIGVDMLPRMDGFVDPPPTDLKALTEGMHTKEALELVREHLLQVMGSAAAFPNAFVKMSKFQMAQVYAASVMFGYFLRRVDARFQLEASLGTLPVSREDAVARLERLFAMAEDIDSAPHPDFAQARTIDLDQPAPSGNSTDSDSSISSSGTSTSYGSSSSSSVPMRKERSALRRYVEAFDQVTMVHMARIVSQEGAALVERQTSALLGDLKRLTKQMQEVVGEDAGSFQEAMSRMAKAVESDEVETVTMSTGTQRRAVLEAVAFGTFLRDVEGWVNAEYHLLTPLPTPEVPPYMGGEGGAAA